MKQVKELNTLTVDGATYDLGVEIFRINTFYKVNVVDHRNKVFHVWDIIHEHVWRFRQNGYL